MELFRKHGEDQPKTNFKRDDFSHCKEQASRKQKENLVKSILKRLASLSKSEDDKTDPDISMDATKTTKAQRYTKLSFLSSIVLHGERERKRKKWVDDYISSDTKKIYFIESRCSGSFALVSAMLFKIAVRCCAE
jgi:hypothetical protein